MGRALFAAKNFPKLILDESRFYGSMEIGTFFAGSHSFRGNRVPASQADAAGYPGLRFPNDTEAAGLGNVCFNWRTRRIRVSQSLSLGDSASWAKARHFLHCSETSGNGRGTRVGRDLGWDNFAEKWDKLSRDQVSNLNICCHKDLGTTVRGTGHSHG